MNESDKAEPCSRCGYELDTFACRIRHIALHHGWAANDH